MIVSKHAYRVRGPRVGVVAAWLNLVVLGVLLIHVSGGTTFGWALSAGTGPDRLILLGTTLDDAACTSAPLAVGQGRAAFCPDFSAITTRAGTVEVVSVYAAGNPMVDEYTGPMPEGLRWGDTIQQVGDRMGEPHRITDMYGPPTLVYMFDDERYGSLELQFNAADRLIRINACLTR